MFSPTEYKALRDCPHWAAERMGRRAAFKDIESKGFARAYAQSQVVDGSLQWDSPAWAFLGAYRQVVYGWWMAFMP